MEKSKKFDKNAYPWENIAGPLINSKFPGNLSTSNQMHASWNNLKRTAKGEFAKQSNKFN